MDVIPPIRAGQRITPSSQVLIVMKQGARLGVKSVHRNCLMYQCYWGIYHMSSVVLATVCAKKAAGYMYQQLHGDHHRGTCSEAATASAAVVSALWGLGTSTAVLLW